MKKHDNIIKLGRLFTMHDMGKHCAVVELTIEQAHW